MRWPSIAGSGSGAASPRRGMAEWEDLVQFEVIPVITSAEAAAVVAPP